VTITLSEQTGIRALPDCQEVAALRSVQVRRARAADAGAMARIFVSCFADSVRYLFPGGPPVPAVRRIMLFLRWAEPGSCLVAVTGGDNGAREKVVGYCIAPPSMFRVWMRAPFSRHIWSIAAMFVTGRLHLNARLALRTLTSKAAFLNSFRVASYQGSAQILSLGVDPDARGLGIGSALVAAALKYLTAAGIREVKLEVRPDNTPARRIYSRHGFTEVGETEDDRGAWLVMVKALRPDESDRSEGPDDRDYCHGDGKDQEG